MKRINCVFYAVTISMLLGACNHETEKKGNFNLLPLPQEFEIKGSSELTPKNVLKYFSITEDDLPVLGKNLSQLTKAESARDAQVLFSINTESDLPAEGYLLSTKAKQINIEAKDEAGLFYAMATLDQLMEDAIEQEVALPLCGIKDFPKIPKRFLHIDIKHHREKLEYMYHILDVLSAHKINQVIIEFEDKLAYETRPVVGAADAFSIDEWIEWSEYAHERNIEVSPLVQGLGHANFILKHEEFKHLRDDPESDWAFNPLMPETYELQFDLYKDALKATPYGKYLNVGGDEVETTGGKLRKGQSSLELQLIWLNKVCNYAEEHGRIPMVWDDMFLKLSGVHDSMFDESPGKEQVDSIWSANAHKLDEFIELFPENCIFLRWHYHGPANYGNQKAINWYRRKGLMCIPTTAATVRWVLMPQDEGKLHLIKQLSEVSVEKNMEGIFLSTWDDESPHFETYLRAIYAFAEYAWTGPRRDLPEIRAAIRHRRFSAGLSDEKYAFIDDLETPVFFWSNAFIKWHNPDRIWGDRAHINYRGVPPQETILDIPVADKPGEWSKQYKERLDKADSLLNVCKEIDEIIKLSKEKAVRNHYSLEVYNQINQMVMFNFRVLQTIRAYDVTTTPDQKEKARAAMMQLPDEFRSLRKKFEEVYSETRILHKPDNFIIDQNHHRHLANMTINFDWQFHPEIYLMRKIENLKR